MACVVYMVYKVCLEFLWYVHVFYGVCGVCLVVYLYVYCGMSGVSSICVCDMWHM